MDESEILMIIMTFKDVKTGSERRRGDLSGSPKTVHSPDITNGGGANTLLAHCRTDTIFIEIISDIFIFILKIVFFHHIDS